MKNGDKVFMIDEGRIYKMFPRRFVARKVTLIDYRNGAEKCVVDTSAKSEIFGVSPREVYTEDIFATKREALEEILARLDKNKSAIEEELEFLNNHTVKFSAKQIFEIIVDEYRKADVMKYLRGAWLDAWQNAMLEWAAERENREYQSEDELRDEIKQGIANF